MSAGHFHNAGGYIDHGDATALFPVAALAGTVHTHRDAVLVLGAADREAVLVVRPTGLASSYALTQRPLTAVEIESLDNETREALTTTAEVDLDGFEYVQIGRSTTPACNRSLAEF
ncbi:hypothetical protein [Halorientalis marina]|uniref:hypothetical protein n=1 Tax=Halorientalis marina TaxID=2931976 RepID=UPI001FF40872|nr:hypothetical protein [Halorientalis marina]